MERRVDWLWRESILKMEGKSLLWRDKEPLKWKSRGVVPLTSRDQSGKLSLIILNTVLKRNWTGFSGLLLSVLKEQQYLFFILFNCLRAAFFNAKNVYNNPGNPLFQLIFYYSKLFLVYLNLLLIHSLTTIDSDKQDSPFIT